jgi:hypothetical protein
MSSKTSVPRIDPRFVASHLSQSGDPKDGVLIYDSLEVVKRRAAVDREKRTCSRRQLKISPQDRSALVGQVLHQSDVFALTVPQHRTAVGTQVSHPVALLAEHGHQVALTLVVGDHHRERNRPSRLVAAYFKCGGPVRSNTGRKSQGAQSVCDTR